MFEKFTQTEVRSCIIRSVTVISKTILAMRDVELTGCIGTVIANVKR